MNTIEINAKNIVKESQNANAKLVGDDFIGYKFTGIGSEFWNSLLMLVYNQGEDVGETLNSKWLKENEIPYIDYDPIIWNEGEK